MPHEGTPLGSSPSDPGGKYGKKIASNQKAREFWPAVQNSGEQNASGTVLGRQNNENSSWEFCDRTAKTENFNF